MYLRESKQRRADGSVVTYLQLAENVWDAAKGRSQDAAFVHNCGRADDPDVIERLRRLAKSILRRCSPEEIVVPSGDWRLICAWPYGDLYVLEAIWAAAWASATSCGSRPARGISDSMSNVPCSPWSPTGPGPGLETLLP